MKLIIAILIIVSITVITVIPREQDTPTEPPTPGALGVLADHHLHARSQADLDFMFEMDAKMTGEFKGPPLDPDMPVITVEDLIEQLDLAEIRHGVLLSSAYFFGFPEYDASLAEKRTKTEEANNFAAGEAAKFPDRLQAFCSVNPLLDFASTEITRCKQVLGLSGVKLHFGGSDVDLRDPEQLAALRQFFDRIRKLDLFVILHIRTRSLEFGRTDIMNFVNEVLLPNPGLSIQIAHLSGR
jgi:predicted TIM-barrel fold metal-dependent hydrolase